MDLGLLKMQAMRFILSHLNRALHLAVIYNHQNLLRLLPQLPPTDTPEVDRCNKEGWVSVLEDVVW